MLVEAVDVMPRWARIGIKLQVVARASTKHRQVLPRSIDRDPHPCGTPLRTKSRNPASRSTTTPIRSSSLNVSASKKFTRAGSCGLGPRNEPVVMNPPSQYMTAGMWSHAGVGSDSVRFKCCASTP
ncbi:hypothetical protein GQ600_6333 [Phytophthora cactorum]|nr:hypothetical protein GQ600_6333 [Phytophthora cactorum]